MGGGGIVRSLLQRGFVWKLNISLTESLYELFGCL